MWWKENVTHQMPSSRMKKHWESVVDVAGQPTASPKDMRRRQQPRHYSLYDAPMTG